LGAMDLEHTVGLRPDGSVWLPAWRSSRASGPAHPKTSGHLPQTADMRLPRKSLRQSLRLAAHFKPEQTADVAAGLPRAQPTPVGRRTG
jgi:hypothetical protein